MNQFIPRGKFISPYGKVGFLWELPEPLSLGSARKWCVIENMQVPGNVYWTISLKRAETTEKYQIPYHSV